MPSLMKTDCFCTNPLGLTQNVGGRLYYKIPYKVMSDTTTEMCFSNLNRKRSKINAALERDKKKGKSAGKGMYP